MISWGGAQGGTGGAFALYVKKGPGSLYTSRILAHILL